MTLISELGPILFLAALLGLLMARLGQPPLLGYLLAGVLARAGVVGQEFDAGTFRSLGDLGIVLLLFYLGLELSWHKMSSIAGRSLALALAVTGLPFLLFHNMFLLLGVAGLTGVLMAFILAIHSTALPVQLLESRGEVGSRVGHLFIGVGLIVDVLAILGVALIGIGSHGESSVGGLILTMSGFAAACATVGVAVIPRFLDSLQAHPASRLLLPITLIGIALMIAYAGHLIGVPISVGAFLAGAMVSESKHCEALEAHLFPIKELFLGLFFVAVGFELDLSLLPALIPAALGLTVLLALVRFAAGTGLAYVLGEETIDSLRLGVLLIPVSELVFVLIASSGLQGEWRDWLYGVATIMFVTTAIVMSPLERLAPRLEQWLAHRSAGAVRHLLYVLRGAVAPSMSPAAGEASRVRMAFREVLLALIVLVGLGVGIAGTSNWLDSITPAWIDFTLLGFLLSVAILVPGFVIVWRQWGRFLTALIGPDKTGPGTDRIRLIQRATRGALTTLLLGLMTLGLLPYAAALWRPSRIVVLGAVLLIGLLLAFVFRKSVGQLHELLVSGMWGAPTRPMPTPPGSTDGPPSAPDPSTTPSTSPVEGRTP